jgi:hypothetical protein
VEDSGKEREDFGVTSWDLLGIFSCEFLL